MEALHLREVDIEIVERVRYHKETRKAVTRLMEHGATQRDRAVRASEIGMIPSAWSWWLTYRGVIKRTSSGKYWVDTQRHHQLAAGAPVRMAVYIAIASLFSGATMAMAAAGF